MDRQQIGTRLVMEGLGLDLRMADFDNRLILQKAVYLAQAAGVGLGYQFHWYLRGPYCSLLAADGYSVAAEAAVGDDESEQWKLDATTQGKVKVVRRLISEGRAPGSPRWLELLASVHFLVTHRQVARDAAKIADRLKAFGKDFTEDQVAEALRQLQNHGLIAAA